MSATGVFEAAVVPEAEEDLPIPVHLQKAWSVLVRGLRESPALRKGLSSLTYPVTTKSREAQAYFDQGLRFMYAFNYGEAILAFRAPSGQRGGTIFRPGLVLPILRATQPGFSASFLVVRAIPAFGSVLASTTRQSKT